MPKCSCGHSVCHQRTYGPNTQAARSELQQVVTNRDRLVYVCGATKGKNKKAFCCKCGGFTI